MITVLDFHSCNCNIYTTQSTITRNSENTRNITVGISSTARMPRHDKPDLMARNFYAIEFTKRFNKKSKLSFFFFYTLLKAKEKTMQVVALRLKPHKCSYLRGFNYFIPPVQMFVNNYCCYENETKKIKQKSIFFI